MALNIAKFSKYFSKNGLYFYTHNAHLRKHQIRSFRLCVRLFGDPIQVNMPVLSPTMESGTIVKWHKKEGDSVTAGDMLCEIQTDKAVVAFDIEEDGTLAKILQPENTQIKVGALIALLVEEGDDWKNVEIPAHESSDAAPQASQVTVSSTSSVAHSHGRGIGPAVRNLLDIYKLQGNSVPATGPNGRLLKGDVLQHIKQHGLKPAPADIAKPPIPEATKKPAQPPAKPVSTPIQTAKQAKPIEKEPVKKPMPPALSAVGVTESGDAVFSDIPLTGMRKTIAKRLTESKTTIPHSYASIDCNMQNVLSLRKDLKSDGVNVSVNDFIIKASAVALQRVPEVNAVWTGSESRILSGIDISVAVATDSGLITPIVKDAIGLGLQDISATVRDLSARARDGKLQLHEFQGGSFTISNLGMYGITEFSAVINPPQACILAVGGSRLTLNAEGSPQTLMTVTLSADSRIVDDFLAAKFLDAFREAIEEPMSMLSQTFNMAKLFAK